MGPFVSSVRDVAEKHLCTGCGACAWYRPDAIEMVDDLDRGRRPLLAPGGEAAAREALAVCPGHRLEHEPFGPEVVPELAREWGPVLEVWEGYAFDPGLRLAASSGGAATALALFAIERGGMHGVLHIAARPDVPWLNRTVLSRTRDEMMAATGSRYAPASPCDGLAQVEAAPSPCVFIGKPCDVAATKKARRLRPELDARLGLTIGIFCAGTPSTRGTLEMLERMGVDDPSEVRSVRYRGNGWPGRATVHARGERGEKVASISYEESWGEILQKHRQWRCYVCADHTGEFADVSVGDPWYRPLAPDEPGQSLVIARTERGRELVKQAVAARYLVLEPRRPSILPASQPNLEKARGSIWARSLVCRLLGAAAPSYRRMPTFPSWLFRLSAREKLSSVFGTAKRVFKKRLLFRRPVRPYRHGS